MFKNVLECRNHSKLSEGLIQPTQQSKNGVQKKTHFLFTAPEELLCYNPLKQLFKAFESSMRLKLKQILQLEVISDLIFQKSPRKQIFVTSGLLI